MLLTPRAGFMSLLVFRALRLRLHSGAVVEKDADGVWFRPSARVLSVGLAWRRRPYEDRIAPGVAIGGEDVGF